jgi:hypothetical protein
MPVPPGLLMDIAILIAREYWRSRKRRAAPTVTRAPAPARAPVRRLSPVGRALRLAVIVGVLWLIWREVARRRAVLIEARRTAVNRSAPMTAVSPALPPAPTASALPPPPSAAPVEPVEHVRAATSASDSPPPEYAAPAEPSPASGDVASSVASVEPVARAVSGADASDFPPSEHAAPGGEEISNGALIGWCARCRARHPMQQVTFEINASGRSIARGTCPVCGAAITRFVSRKQEEHGSVEG